MRGMGQQRRPGAVSAQTVNAGSEIGRRAGRRAAEVRCKSVRSGRCGETAPPAGTFDYAWGTALLRPIPESFSVKLSPRPILCRSVALLAAAAAAAVQATGWTEKRVPDPIAAGATCEVSVPESFGSYIYDWPSKFDQVFWPITTLPGIWFCRQSGFAAFIGDFDGIDAEQRGAVAAYLAAQYRSPHKPEPPELLALLEGCYSQRRLDARQQITVLRAVAWHREQLGDLEGAAQRRTEALELIVDALDDDTLEAPRRLEYLFVASAYSRWLGDNGQSTRYQRELREALKRPDATVPDGFVKYLRELSKEIDRIRRGGTLAPGSDVLRQH